MWANWVYLAGRGTGKTRSGAEWVKWNVEENGVKRIALVAPTAADVRDVMVLGESGILGVSCPWNMPRYMSSQRKVIWPNGAIATMYSSQEPDRLRGPQHEIAWSDEITSFIKLETWDMLQFGLRLGANPQNMVTTTPKVGHRLLRELLRHEHTRVTTGSTRENAANLAPSFLEKITRKYEGTRLGQQELEGIYIDALEGALWNLNDILHLKDFDLTKLERILVAVDPAITKDVESDETGIIVAGVDDEQNGYVLEDLSGHYSPDEWGKVTVAAFRRWKANGVVVEANNGGEMVVNTIQQVDKNVPVDMVYATKGKRLRAEPVGCLYEQQRIYHLGEFAILEDQMVSFNPEFSNESPDRVDALVHVLTGLIIDSVEPRIRHV